MNRRRLVQTLISLSSVTAIKTFAAPSSDPWTENQLLDCAKLAALLKDAKTRPVIIAVVFPVLYRQKHIPGAKFAGPGSKPEGIESLKQTVAALPHDTPVVLYCGCCPMHRCPNIRPAFSALAALGFTNVRVLDLPESFRVDWEDKGYPITSLT